MLELADLIFKLLGSIVAIIAIFQLIEAKKKRMVDMYWKVFELYKSTNVMESREVISSKISDKIPAFAECFNPSQKIDKQTKSQLSLEYMKIFHDADGDSEEKKNDRKARAWISVLNQMAILSNKDLIDKDLLFGLVDPALEIDYCAIQIIADAHRKAHDCPNMWNEIEFMYEEYKKWKQKV